MSVSSASTDQAVEAEYEDTLGYALTGDVALARRHVIAAGIRVSRTADKIGRGGNSVELRTQLESIRASQRDALTYLRQVGALPTPATASANQLPRVYDVSGVRE